MFSKVVLIKIICISFNMQFLVCSVFVVMTPGGVFSYVWFNGTFLFLNVSYPCTFLTRELCNGIRVFCMYANDDYLNTHVALLSPSTYQS